MRGMTPFRAVGDWANRPTGTAARVRATTVLRWHERAAIFRRRRVKLAHGEERWIGSMNAAERVDPVRLSAHSPP